MTRDFSNVPPDILPQVELLASIEDETTVSMHHGMKACFQLKISEHPELDKSLLLLALAKGALEASMHMISAAGILRDEDAHDLYIATIKTIGDLYETKSGDGPPEQ